MPLSTTIRQDKTDIPFNMQLVFDRERNRYVVQFNSMSRLTDHSEEKSFSSFGAALTCYVNNCVYHHVPAPARITEEEFLGVPEGFLFPKVKAPVFKREVR